MKKTKLLLAMLFSIAVVACGGGGNSAPTTVAPAPVVDSATTTAIQAYMSTSYNNEQSVVSSSIINCFRQYGVSGQSIVCSVNSKQASVQNFLNAAIAYIQTVKNNTPIDKTAIANMLSTYRAQDLAWLTVSALSPTYIMTSAELAAVAPTYNASVNGSYANATSQLNAM